MRMKRGPDTLHASFTDNDTEHLLRGNAVFLELLHGVGCIPAECKSLALSCNQAHPVLQALKLFPAIVIVPTMQISWTLFSILSGGIYYQEYTIFTTLSAAMFAVGVAVSSFVLCQASRLSLPHSQAYAD